MSDILKPAARPCGSCPYLKSTPSGLWAAEEYEKLPRYDGPTHEQPTGVFMCHQRDGCLCGGWLLTHDRNNLLALRFAAVFRSQIDDSVWTYNPEGVEVFASGQEACDHGLRDIDEPGPEAQRIMRGLTKLPNIKLKDED